MSYGNGIRLVQGDNDELEPWDIVIDATGDVASERDTDELQKDIAFRVAINVNRELGQVQLRQNRKRIEVIIRNVLLSDARIRSVRDITVEEAPTNSNEVNARVTALTESEEIFEDVIEV